MVLPDHLRPWGSRGQAHGVAGGVGLQPTVTTSNPRVTPRWSSTPTLSAFLTLPTLLTTLSESPLDSRTPREAVDRSHKALTALKGSSIKGSIGP